jgi:cyclohexanone monooxygenase
MPTDEGVDMGDDGLDVIVVGAGFSGLYALHRLRGSGLSVQVLEAGEGVGGTWYWNRYPGARCDVPSWEYSYSFSPELEQDWVWTERYAGQPEILRYLDHVADRFDLRRDIELGVTVTSAAFDGASRAWSVAAADGRRWTARFLVMATGGLSRPKDPGLPGLAEFRGEVLRTSRWPHDGVDLTGRRVGVVGTGSSGIQVVPVVAESAEHLVVLQRTPQFTIPARNGPLDPDELAGIKSRYREIRAEARRTGFGLAAFTPLGRKAVDVDADEREREFDRRWEGGGPQFLVAFDDLIVDAEANGYAADYVRRRIAETVADPETAARLTPTGYPLGCKRLCNDTGYYETFNRPNVTLVDLTRCPIRGFTAAEVLTADARYPLDVLVLATGFDALTGALTAVDVRGEDGHGLAQAWRDGPVSHLGLMVAGFPNLFTVTGPGSPSLLSNMVTSIEQHVEWIDRCLADLRARGLSRIEARREAQQAWSRTVAEVAGATVFAAPNCSSYYRGDNIAGKSRTFLPYAGGVHTYQQILQDEVEAGYPGFHLS